jgi:hypothetical protein
VPAPTTRREPLETPAPAPRPAAGAPATACGSCV